MRGRNFRRRALALGRFAPLAVVLLAGACGAPSAASTAPTAATAQASAPISPPTPTAATFPLVPRAPILPVKVAGLEHAIDVSASFWTQCTVLAAGTVDCWGDTWMDVHGYGLDGDALTKPTPMAGVSGVVQVAAGGGLICALERVGTVMCWGLTVGGDFQDNPTDMWVARREPGITGATSISAGFKSACAVLIGAKVICWGDDGRSSPASNVTVVATGLHEDDFLLADGTVAYRPGSGPPRSDAVGLVPGLTDVAAIAAGDLSSCAVVRGGSVYCWGVNTYGQLGDGTTTDSALPVAVAGVTDATAVSIGLSTACALLRDGTVTCWGDAIGKGGDGVVAHDPSPIPVSGLTGVKEISVGDYKSCVLLDDGTVSCWASPE